MGVRPLDHLPNEIVIALLEKIAPGSAVRRVELMPGSFSNHTHLAEVCLPNGEVMKFVVRRYQVFGNYDRGEKARREYKAFELMNRAGIPSPEPLLLDDTGELLGVPGIVTGFVQGKMLLDPPVDPMTWAHKLAIMLARIHGIPVDEAARKFLLDANREATWFLYKGVVPEDMRVFPGGTDLWQRINRLYLARKPTRPALVHVDYWQGNILWEDGEITAVLDWEEAACGDPVIDVAYARMNMYLMGLPEAADEFLQAYEAETGRKAENLGLWELSAAARPMADPVAWEMSREGLMEKFGEFLNEAKERAGQGV